MEEELKQAKEKIALLEKENKEYKDTNTTLNDQLKGKDEDIATLKQNAKKQGENFKKLRDMSEAEKAEYTEKELELMKRQEEFEIKQEQDRQDRLAFEGKQRQVVIDNLANKYSRGDKELAEQIKINLGKLNPELVNPAMTEVELTPFVESAFNMLGVIQKPDALREANNYTGGTAEVKSDKDFADTKEGKDLAGMMGLSQAKVENNNNNEGK